MRRFVLALSALALALGIAIGSAPSTVDRSSAEVEIPVGKCYTHAGEIVC
ncbi:hypothetical protein [Virgisporangium aliadipatigenens]|nr:hypothetical protein [Virgisporangium aliadipatigenens]